MSSLPLPSALSSGTTAGTASAVAGQAATPGRSPAPETGGKSFGNALSDAIRKINKESQSVENKEIDPVYPVDNGTADPLTGALAQEAAATLPELPAPAAMRPSLVVQTLASALPAGPDPAAADLTTAVLAGELHAGKDLPVTGQPLPPDADSAPALPPDGTVAGTLEAAVDSTLPTLAGEASDPETRHRHAARGEPGADASPDWLAANPARADVQPPPAAGLVAALVTPAPPAVAAAATGTDADSAPATGARPERGIDPGLIAGSGVATAPRSVNPATVQAAVPAGTAPVPEADTDPLPSGDSLAGLPPSPQPAASGSVPVGPRLPVDPDTGLVMPAPRQGMPTGQLQQPYAGAPVPAVAGADAGPDGATARPAMQPGIAPAPDVAADARVATTASVPAELPAVAAGPGTAPPGTAQPDVARAAARPGGTAVPTGWRPTREPAQVVPVTPATEPVAAVTADADGALRAAIAPAVDDPAATSDTPHAQSRKPAAVATEAAVPQPIPLVMPSGSTVSVPALEAGEAAVVGVDLALPGLSDGGKRNADAGNAKAVAAGLATGAQVAQAGDATPVAMTAARMPRAPIDLATTTDDGQGDGALDMAVDPGSPRDWLRAIGSERALMPQAQHLPIGTPALTGAEAAKSAPAPLSLFAANAGGDTWGEEIGQRILWMSGRALKSAHIQLDPPELGPLQVRVSNEAGGTSIHFTTHSASVRDIVEQSLPRLRDMLESSGTQLLDVNVAHQQGRGEQSARDLAWTARGGMLAGDAEADEGFVTATAPARLPLGLVDQFV